MSDRPTPMCNSEQFHRDNGHAREHSIVVSVEFARDLERQRDAYAETLQIIAKSNDRSHHPTAYSVFIRNRHPELADNESGEAAMAYSSSTPEKLTRSAVALLYYTM